MGWVIDGLRTISASIDFGLLYLAKLVYEVFMQIASVDLLADGTLTEFTTRIYILLGIFMLIKITISLFKYLIDPDSFTDKSRGFGKLIQNIVVSLILIVSVPFVYDTAMRIQGLVLNNNVIGKFILGQASSSNDQNAAGESVIFSVFNSFLTVRSDLTADSKCKTVVNEDTKQVVSEMYSLYNQNYKDNFDCATIDSGNPSEGSVILNCDCKDELKKYADSEADVTAYQNAYSKGNFEGVKEMIYGNGSGVPINAKIKDNDNYTYLFSYTWGVSWLAAAFLIYIFASFCVDVGIRVVKLAFLVIIAPIPILSKIDPTGKGEMFNKWAKMCGYTYLDVFIRYASVFFIVFVISKLPAIMSTLFTSGGGVLATLFIIFGALLFAKELPKLLSELIPGMKDFGGGFGKSLKKLGEAPILGRGVKSLTAGTAAGFAAYRANRWDRKNENKVNTAAAELAAKQRARANGSGALSAWAQGKKAKVATGTKGMLDNMSLRNMSKDAKGIGRDAKNASDEAWSSTGWLGGENKNSLSKAKAAKTKATNEQLTKMRDGYKTQNKEQKIYDQIQGNAKRKVESNKSQIEADAIKRYDEKAKADGKPTFDKLIKEDQQKELSSAVKAEIEKEAAINEQSMYVNKDFGKKVTALREAKTVRDTSQSTYEKAKISVENGSTIVNGEEMGTMEKAIAAVDTLRVNSIKASKNFDFMSQELKDAAALSPNDADTYVKYEKAKDTVDKKAYMATEYDKIINPKVSTNKANTSSATPNPETTPDHNITEINMDESKERVQNGNGSLVENLRVDQNTEVRTNVQNPQVNIRQQTQNIQQDLAKEVTETPEVKVNIENEQTNIETNNEKEVEDKKE